MVRVTLPGRGGQYISDQKGMWDEVQYKGSVMELNRGVAGVCGTRRIDMSREKGKGQANDL